MLIFWKSMLPPPPIVCVLHLASASVNVYESDICFEILNICDSVLFLAGFDKDDHEGPDQKCPDVCLTVIAITVGHFLLIISFSAVHRFKICPTCFIHIDEY